MHFIYMRPQTQLISYSYQLMTDLANNHTYYTHNNNNNNKKFLNIKPLYFIDIFVFAIILYRMYTELVQTK